MLFGKNNGEERPRNPDTVFGIRVITGGYILYMVYQTIHMYFAEPGQHELWMLLLTAGFLTPAGLFVLISGYISWRREKKALQEEETAGETDETEETVFQDETDA